MVAARLTHLCEVRRLIPPEQVGFRRSRAAEDNLARLVQSVQDGWNKPKARGRPVDGVTADKFALVAYDFARAYDTIDHRMLLNPRPTGVFFIKRPSGGGLFRAPL